MSRKLKERITALLLAGGIAVGSMFSLSGCKGSNVEVENEEKVNIEEVFDAQEDQIKELKDQIKEMKDQLNETQKQINNLENQQDDIEALQQQLKQLSIKQQLIELLSNSYQLTEFMKIYADAPDAEQNALLYSSKDKSVCVGRDSEYEMLYAFDGKEIKGIRLNGENVKDVSYDFDPTTHLIFLQYLKYDVLKDDAYSTYEIITKDDECTIIRTVYTDKEQTNIKLVQKVCYNVHNENKITKIEIDDQNVDINYTFEEISEQEFKNKYSEVEARIDELENQSNSNLGV